MAAMRTQMVGGGRGATREVASSERGKPTAQHARAPLLFHAFLPAAVSTPVAYRSRHGSCLAVLMAVLLLGLFSLCASYYCP
jgi:hypothetical protein